MDIEKTIEFLLEHQAWFAADIDMLKERHKELADSVQQLGLVVAAQQQQIAHIISITEALARNQAALTEAQRASTEAQRHTDQRLNALIKIVDEVIRRREGERQ